MLCVNVAVVNTMQGLIDRIALLRRDPHQLPTTTISYNEFLLRYIVCALSRF